METFKISSKPPQAAEQSPDRDHGYSKLSLTDDSSPMTKPAQPPPSNALPGPFDKGWLPWTQVLGSFAVWTNSWGLFNSYV